MTGQGSLLTFDEAGAVTGIDPDARCSTSHLAGESITPVAGTLRAAVLAAIAERQAGLTDDEGEEVTGLRHQTYSARRRELALAGLIVKSGDRRPTSSGRLADAWVVAP